MKNISTVSLAGGLLALHAGTFLLASGWLAPLLAGSVYLPLTALKMAGLPVYANPEAWGWAAPSVFGWCAVVVLWGIAWWSFAAIVIRLRRLLGTTASEKQ